MAGGLRYRQHAPRSTELRQRHKLRPTAVKDSVSGTARLLRRAVDLAGMLLTIHFL